jgi:hypothetical protein
MFSSSKAGLCLFDKDGSSVLVDAFNQAAKAYIDSGKSLIFTHIDVKYVLKNRKIANIWVHLLII